MGPGRKSRPLFALVGLLALAGCRESQNRGDVPAGPAAALPAAVGAWAREGEPQVFPGDELYVYIDGGADIYQEYGFVSVAVQDYRNQAGKSVSLEIFEMTAPESAFGMWSLKSSGKGRAIPVGDDGELESYYLNFRKGRFLVTLTGFDESDETVAGLLALGGAVAERIHSPAAARPELVSVLPSEGLRAGSLRYFRGLLGLNNIYSFLTARGLGFQEGIKGDYGAGGTLIVLRYGTIAEASMSLLELCGALAVSDRFSASGPEEGGSFRARDANGRVIHLAASGDRILVGLDDDAERARALVARAR